MGVLMKNKRNYSAGNILMTPECYSTEEREIGCWIDGKPLYQKVWVFNSPITLGGSFSTVANIDSTNIENVVYVYAVHEDGTGYGDINADPTRNNHTLLGLRAYDTRYIVKLILQYTKISDTPGSGTWTPSGAKAEHYSTNEHVVGTWIDGSTVYEKTVAVTNNITSNMTVQHGISDFGNYVSIDGVVRRANGDAEPINDYPSATLQISGYNIRIADFTSTDFSVHIDAQRLSDVTGIYITVRYTKTTS